VLPSRCRAATEYCRASELTAECYRASAELTAEHYRVGAGMATELVLSHYRVLQSNTRHFSSTAELIQVCVRLLLWILIYGVDIRGSSGLSQVHRAAIRWW
jgi:hypothetical protein